MVAMPSYVHPFPVTALPPVSNPYPHPLASLPPLFLHFHGPQLVGGSCVPTEQYGLIFQDMGFTVYEYCIWNPKELCSDPTLFFDLMEVGGPPTQNRLPL